MMNVLRSSIYQKLMWCDYCNIFFNFNYPFNAIYYVKLHNTIYIAYNIKHENHTVFQYLVQCTYT